MWPTAPSAQRQHPEYHQPNAGRDGDHGSGQRPGNGNLQGQVDNPIPAGITQISNQGGYTYGATPPPPTATQ
ncbi:MAG: hypothetical protein IPK16_23640 [Anaerolineales bacterium]|nr:hypothetical protein [Anaerolineales bacterium]